jgi:putative nucleotidyltransferase with HDIG domain
MERPDREKKGKSFRVSRPLEKEPFQAKVWFLEQWKKVQDLVKGKLILLIGLCLFIMIVNTPSLLIPPHRFQVGEAATYDIKAKQDLLLEDQAATELKKQETANALPPVYDFDEEAVTALTQRIQQGFQLLREGARKSAGRTASAGSEAWEKLEKAWGIELTPSEINALTQDRFSISLEEGLTRMIQSVMAVGVVGNKLTLMSEHQRGIVVRKLPSGREVQVKDVERFPDLNEARDRLEKQAAYLLTGARGGMRPVSITLAQKLVIPNLSFNKRESDQRRGKAIQQTRPVFFQIKKGETIVREGEKIDEAALTKIQLQFRQQQGLEIFLTSLGLVLLWGLFVYMAFRLVVDSLKASLNNWRDLIFLTIMLALSFLTIRTADFFAQIFVGGIPGITPRNTLLAIPLAAAPMMVSLVLGPALAILFTLIQASLTALFLDVGPGLSMYFAIAGLWAAQSQRTCHNRWDLIRLGFYLGLLNIGSSLTLQMMQSRLFHWETIAHLLLGFSGGVLSGIVVTGFSPLVEKLFGYTTDMRLLERANMDQPLLRELMVQAPGTYHHSIIVGNMVEAAAEAIGAKPLLARVSAYYHDIGKAPKPLYFIENQMGGENKHEKLAPSMSSLILISHIKDGVEKARRHKLESPIVDIIEQHHGTSLISYFYKKALELMGDDSVQVSTEDFRYPGPKPQTREAGLVMLADAIEAASRTLVDPTPARIKGLVNKIINNAFADGQLDECELTLKDLNQIAGSFNKILNGIFHHRIEYPESPGKTTHPKKKSNGDSTKQSPELDSFEGNSAKAAAPDKGPGSSTGGSEPAAGGGPGDLALQPALPQPVRPD